MTNLLSTLTGNRKIALQQKMQAQSVAKGEIVIPWQADPNGNEYAFFKHGEFDVHVKIGTDYDYDFSECRGEFTDTWQDGVLINPDKGYHGNSYKYFLPMTTTDEHRKSLIKLGYSKGIADEMARKYAYEDMLICLDPDKQDMTAVYIDVRVTYKGVEIGQDALYGIEMKDTYYRSMENDPYINEVANDCLQEALREARAKLEDLRS